MIPFILMYSELNACDFKQLKTDLLSLLPSHQDYLKDVHNRRKEAVKRVKDYQILTDKQFSKPFSFMLTAWLAENLDKEPQE